MMRLRGAVAVFVLLLALVPQASAEESEVQALKSLNFQDGKFDLGSGLASIQTGANFLYLNSEDAERFLTEVWGNPKGHGRDRLGLVVPRDAHPLSEQAWAIIVSYEKSGYISDKDAGTIDYDELLRTMKEDTREGNTERKRLGYPPVDLIGWARKPAYDTSTHTLYWAKQLRFEGGGGDTLNYNLRILGRKGVLILNVVADMKGLPLVEQKLPEILALFTFNDGNRYEQFDPDVDEVAAYGLAGLIAGGILTKTGFFKGLLIALLASKKLLGGLVIAGLAGAWSAFRRFRQR